MDNGNICVSLFSTTAAGLLEQIRQAEPLADIIELRCDHLGAGEAEKLLATLPSIQGKYLFTFRPKAQGGARELSARERTSFWEIVYRTVGDDDYLVDLEHDIRPPAGFDPDRIIASFHDFGSPDFDPAAAFDLLASTGAGIIKIAFASDEITDTIVVTRLIGKARTTGKRIVPIAMGGAGKWTRILGLPHGAYMTYASLLGGGETAPGQISAADLLDVYRVKELDEDTDVYGIIAGDTSYSMSPYIHNAAFAASGMNAVFVPLQVDDVGEFMRRMVNPATRELDLNFKGFSVTNPHKRSIIGHLDKVHPDAAAIGAVNTVKIDGGELCGFNTDAEGFIKPLLDTFGSLERSRSAVVGTGGAARACVRMLKKHGSTVTVFGRDPKAAAAIGAETQTSAASLPAADFADFEIVVNATPLGTRGPFENLSIATADQLAGTKLIYDLTYNPAQTRLAREAAHAGVEFIGGLEMLVTQAVAQFNIWTGSDAPADEMRAAVLRRLNS